MNVVDSNCVCTGFPKIKKSNTKIANCSFKLIIKNTSTSSTFSLWKYRKTKRFLWYFQGEVGRCFSIFIVDFEWRFRYSVWNIWCFILGSVRCKINFNTAGKLGKVMEQQDRSRGSVIERCTKIINVLLGNSQPLTVFVKVPWQVFGRFLNTHLATPVTCSKFWLRTLERPFTF